MSQKSSDFYLQRACDSAAEAKAATLENVRKRALRAEASWLELARQARSVARQRLKFEADKTAARLAAAEILAGRSET